MQIRRATLADLDPIEALWREMMDFHAAFDDHFTLSSQADANHRIHMTNLLQDESKRIFVADDGDQLLGYLMAEIKTYPPIYLVQKYGYIGTISVTESARRTGIGSKLLNAALDWFRDNDLQRVECAVAVENPVSRGFWKGVGFREIKETLFLDL